MPPFSNTAAVSSSPASSHFTIFILINPNDPNTQITQTLLFLRQLCELLRSQVAPVAGLERRIELERTDGDALQRKDDEMRGRAHVADLPLAALAEPELEHGHVVVLGLEDRHGDGTGLVSVRHLHGAPENPELLVAPASRDLDHIGLLVLEARMRQAV